MEDAKNVLLVSQYQASAVGELWAGQHAADFDTVRTVANRWYVLTPPERRWRADLEAALSALFGDVR